MTKQNGIETIEITDTLHLGYGGKISSVKILNDAKNIKTIKLEGTAFITDFNFITQCENLEVLILNDVSIDNLTFLESCSNIKVISCDSVKINKYPDFSKLKNLEFLSITNSGLTDIKNFTIHGENLSYINLSYNKINTLPKLRSGDKQNISSKEMK